VPRVERRDPEREPAPHHGRSRDADPPRSLVVGHRPEQRVLGATMVRTSRPGMGRRPTVHLAPELDALQRRAVKIFELDRWLPALSSAMERRRKSATSSSIS
jgi:hypothetical protein